MIRNKGLTVPCAVSLAVHLVLIVVLVRSSAANTPRAPISVEIVTPQPVLAQTPVAVEPPVLPQTLLPRLSAAVPPQKKPVVVAAAAAPDESASASSSELAVPSALTPEATPVVVASAPVHAAEPVVKSSGSSSIDIGFYSSQLGRAVARHRRYPALAAQMGQEGTTLVLVHVRKDGSLDGSPCVAESSGFDLLDKEALAMVGRAAPFAALPDGYQDSVADLRVPVRFHLED